MKSSTAEVIPSVEQDGIKCILAVSLVVRLIVPTLKNCTAVLSTHYLLKAFFLFRLLLLIERFSLLSY
jgi:hypothetical protein